MSQNSQRITADERLDHLYMHAMRCPYCHTKIPQGTAKCETCGITKEQIYYAHTASLRQTNGKLYTKVRPQHLPLWQMVCSAIFGFLGIHCFRAKRYWRGIIIALLNISFVVLFFIFPPAYGENEANATRAMFENANYLFPPDLLGLVGLVLWIWDFFAILFGQFKYPVVLHLETQES